MSEQRRFIQAMSDADLPVWVNADAVEWIGPAWSLGYTEIGVRGIDRPLRVMDQSPAEVAARIGVSLDPPPDTGGQG